MAIKILFADDDAHLRSILRFTLEHGGYFVFEAKSGREALDIFRREKVDLLILDIMMPDGDGVEVCREIRKASEVPILFLSSRHEELDRILGLEAGADDYLTKPFSPKELLLRVQAILRRAAPGAKKPSEAGVLSSGDLKVDRDTFEVFVGGEPVHLTVSEFELLWVLVKYPQKVFTREELSSKVHGNDVYVTDRTIDSHVKRIRQKSAALALRIETVHGLGYRLKVAE